METPPEKVTEGLKAESAAETEVTSATVTTVTAERPGGNLPCHKRPNQSIDYRYLRQQLSIAEVLKLLNFPQPLHSAGMQVRGPCPLHDDRRRRPTFSINLEQGIFQCFARECKAHGNALDLWAKAKGLSIHQAALDLAEKLHLKLQWNREENP